jgi:hypothetical protein
MIASYRVILTAGLWDITTAVIPAVQCWVRIKLLWQYALCESRVR